MKKKIIKVFPDWFASGLWDENGTSIAPLELNIHSNGLQLALNALNMVFECSTEGDYTIFTREVVNTLNKQVVEWLNTMYSRDYIFVAEDY